MQHDHSGAHGTNRQRTISRYVFLGFVAVAAYFLITEHRAHLFGILPFLLLAACPFLHFFHHRGHGHDGEESPPRGGSDAPKDPAGGGHR